MKLHEEIITTVENNNFTISEVEQQDNRFYVELEQFTPLGEDWSETIWFDGTNHGFIYAVVKRYFDFDVDEEAAIWIEHRGTNGVPNSIKSLIEDAEWKEHMLDVLTDDLITLEIYKEV